MNKILKEIPGFPFQYISEDGNLVSFKRKLYEPSPFYDRDGYKRYMVYNESGKRKAVAAHRLVYAAWVSELEDGLTIDHLDGNKRNNHFSNLEQVTASENSKRVNVGRVDPRKNRKLTREIINSVFEMRKRGVSYNKISEAIGMSPAMAWHILKGSTYYDLSGVTK